MSKRTQQISEYNDQLQHDYAMLKMSHESFKQRAYFAENLLKEYLNAAIVAAAKTIEGHRPFQDDGPLLKIINPPKNLKRRTR